MTLLRFFLYCHKVLHENNLPSDRQKAKQNKDWFCLSFFQAIHAEFFSHVAKVRNRQLKCLNKPFKVLNG